MNGQGGRHRGQSKGTYSVQALLHVYTRFDRADGHTVWLPMDQGAGQQFHRSPGNLLSETTRLVLDPAQARIPPIPQRRYSDYIKRVRMKSPSPWTRPYSGESPKDVVQRNHGRVGSGLEAEASQRVRAVLATLSKSRGSNISARRDAILARQVVLALRV